MFILLFISLFGDIPASRTTLQEIVDKELTSPTFAIRERASLKLKKHGFYALPILQENLKHKDIEAARRCSAAYEEYINVSSDLPYFWGTLDSTTASLYQDIISRRHNNEYYSDYGECYQKEALAVFIQDVLEGGVPRIFVEQWLQELRAEDGNWQRATIVIPPPEYDRDYFINVVKARDRSIESMEAIRAISCLRLFYRELLLSKQSK
jgi:hypothetical protein